MENLKIEFSLTGNYVNELKTAIQATKYMNEVVISASANGVSFHLNDLSIEGMVKFPIISDGEGVFVMSKNMMNKLFAQASNGVTFKVNGTLLTLVVDGTDLNVNLPFVSPVLLEEPSETKEVVSVDKERMQTITGLMNINLGSDVSIISVMEFSDLTKIGSSEQIITINTPEFENQRIPITWEALNIIKAVTNLTKDNIKFCQNEEELSWEASYTKFWTPIQKSHFPDISEVEDQDLLCKFNIGNISSVVKSLSKLQIPLVGIQNPLVGLKITDKPESILSVTDIGNRTSHDSFESTLIEGDAGDTISLSISVMSSSLNKTKANAVDVESRDTMIKIPFDEYTVYIQKYI